MKNSTVISNPHATMNHVATVMESPDGGPGGADSETGSPLFGGRALGSGTGTMGSEQVSVEHEENTHGTHREHTLCAVGCDLRLNCTINHQH